MGETTIEWASHSRNYYDWHCNKVSEGCAHCYMMTIARDKRRIDPVGAPQWRQNVFREKVKPGAVYFVNSMSDTYHEEVPVRWIHAIHNDALAHPEATFLVLTKRIERVYYLAPHLAWPQNLWIGASVENENYLWRLNYLLKIPAAGHFVSIEPLLGRISPALRYFLGSVERLDSDTLGWKPHRTAHLKWVIVGAESGKERRPFDKEWASEIRDMCQDYNVPFLFKQGSGFRSGHDRLLDGREWNESPFHLEKHHGKFYPEAAELTPSTTLNGPEQLTLF